MENTENEKPESASITSKKGRFAILGVILLGLAKFGEDGLRLLLHAHGEEAAIAKGAKIVSKYGIRAGIKMLTTGEGTEAVNMADSIIADSAVSNAGR